MNKYEKDVLSPKPPQLILHGLRLLSEKISEDSKRYRWVECSEVEGENIDEY